MSVPGARIFHFDSVIKTGSCEQCLCDKEEGDYCQQAGGGGHRTQGPTYSCSHSSGLLAYKLCDPEKVLHLPQFPPL